MDYQFLAELGIGCGFSAYALSRVTDYLKTRANAIARTKSVQGNFTGISALINNIDQIINEQHKLRQKQIDAGATPESLKPLDEQIARMEWVRANKLWLQFLGPYADQIAGVGMRVLGKIRI